MRRLLALTLLLFSHATLAAPDGAELFAQACAGCHGLDGHGGVGVPLANADFLATVSDNYLSRTIREGRPGRVMPAHRNFSDAQITALVAFIRSWQPADRPSPQEDWKPIQGDAQAGKALFANHCATCHGTKGEGGHGTGVTYSRPRDFPIIPPALNNVGFLYSASDRLIRATIQHGRAGTPMASFADRLSPKEMDDVVAYVRSFSEAPIRWERAENEAPFLAVDSPYSLEETVENLKRAAIGKNYRIIRVQTLENGLAPAEEENPKQVIVYFCNFDQINSALTIDPRVGLFMPCRITAVEWEGEVKLMAMNPKYMSRLFNNAELDRSCETLHQQYLEIMEEATL